MGIGGRTQGVTKVLEHKHWRKIHHQLEKYFSPFFLQRLSLPPGSYFVADSQNDLVFCYLPNPFPLNVGFLEFPFTIHQHHAKFFESEGPFSAGRRFDSHSPHASHHGISGVMSGILKAHKATHLPTLRFLSPLVKEIQRIIRDRLPEVWNSFPKPDPAFPSIGGSIFQTVALNYCTSCAFHRDSSDDLPAWIYYFDSFEKGELYAPELGIDIPVSPKSLLGLHGKWVFHRALPHTGIRSSVSFYCHYTHLSYPKFETLSPEISVLMTKIDWAI